MQFRQTMNNNCFALNRLMLPARPERWPVEDSAFYWLNEAEPYAMACPICGNELGLHPYVVSNISVDKLKDDLRAPFDFTSGGVVIQFSCETG